MRVVLCALLLLLPFAHAPLAQTQSLEHAFTQPLFQMTEAELYANADATTLSEMSYHVAMSVYVLDQSNWNTENIKSEILKAVKIWEQCKLKFTEINVYSITSRNAYPTLEPLEDLKIVHELNLETKPSVFLVHEINNQGTLGYSYRELRDYPNKTEILKGTIWLPDSILAEEYRSQRSPTYSTLAHELAHVLLNLGHTSLRNILGESPALVNGTITPNQCRRLKLGSYVSKI